MLLGQTGKTLAVNGEPDAVGTLPLHTSAQYPRLQVECALEAKDGAAGQVEAFAIDEELNREPVRNIGQFLFPNGNIIEDAREQRGRAGPEVVLFKGTAGTEIAIANAVDTFMGAHFFGVKTILGDLPEIH